MKTWKRSICMMMTIIGLFSVFNGTTQESTAGSTKNAGDNNSDTGFIRKNVRDNMNEIRMAELAIERDVSQDVKNIAIVIRNDHEQMLNELLTYAKEANISGVMETEMNISNDTMGQMSSASGDKGIFNRNRRDDAQSVDKSRNTKKKSKATQEADKGKPSGDRRGTGYDGSREKQATADSSSNAAFNGSAEKADIDHAQHLSELQNASRETFKGLWMKQMTTMHQAKLEELQSSANLIKSAPLKQLVSKAIPKIQKHIELLQQANK